MKFDSPIKIRSGYLASFLLLLFSYILAINAAIQLRNENRWVDHTRQVINKLDMMISYLKDSEIGLRGLIMMKDEKFLLPYYTSEQKVDSLQDLLRLSITDNPLELERAANLKKLIDRKFNVINEQLQSLRATHLEMNDTVRAKAFESKQIMDSIRFIAGLMQNRENELLHERLKTVVSSNNVLYTIIIASFIVSILLIVYSLVTFNMESKAKKKATIEAAGYHDQLEKRIEELHIANQELVELRRLETFTSTGRIARVIAHEVKNPLTNIDLSASQLNDDYLSPDDKKMFLEIIDRNSKRINRLINDLLNATKFSELKYEKADINQLLDETLDDAKDRAQLNKIRIEKKYAKNIPGLQVDKERMKIAFLNIVTNAIESINGKEGLILIETAVRDNMCEINISDNGKGMDRETLSKIFDPYFTLKTRGNGLGLTNTQNIILNHKGKIKAHSELGKGTVFTISLNVEDRKM